MHTGQSGPRRRTGWEVRAARPVHMRYIGFPRMWHFARPYAEAILVFFPFFSSETEGSDATSAPLAHPLRRDTSVRPRRKSSRRIYPRPRRESSRRTHLGRTSLADHEQFFVGTVYFGMIDRSIRAILLRDEGL